VDRTGIASASSHGSAALRADSFDFQGHLIIALLANSSLEQN